MRRLLLRSAFVGFGIGLVVWSLGATGVPNLEAATKAKKQAAAAPPGKKVNACGCYADAANNCFCGRSKGKGKCDCPGECEPKGCEEKRAKQMEKEVAAETKKAAEADKKQKQKSVEAEKKEKKREASQ